IGGIGFGVGSRRAAGGFNLRQSGGHPGPGLGAGGRPFFGGGGVVQTRLPRPWPGRPWGGGGRRGGGARGGGGGGGGAAARGGGGRPRRGGGAFVLMPEAYPRRARRGTRGALSMGSDAALRFPASSALNVLEPRRLEEEGSTRRTQGTQRKRLIRPIRKRTDT